MLKDGVFQDALTLVSAVCTVVGGRAAHDVPEGAAATAHSLVSIPKYSKK
jgi:hypothetical protein